MGKQINQHDRDRDERYGEEMAQRTVEEQGARLADTAMGTGNDDPIDNWATPPAAGSTMGAGGNVTSGNNDLTDEIGAPTEVKDSQAENEEGYNSDEPHRQGVGTQETTMSHQPQNSE